MSTSRNLLLVFLLPALLILFITLVFGASSLNQLKTQFTNYQTLNTQDLRTIKEAIRFTEALDAQHQELLVSINAARNDLVGELKLGFIYSDQQASFNQLANQVESLAESALVSAVNETSRLRLRTAFADYQNFALEALEILQTNPEKAEQTLQHAYLEFHEATQDINHIKTLLAEQAEERTQVASLEFLSTAQKQMLAGLVALLSLLFVSLMLIRWFADRLLMITQALVSLASNRDAEAAVANMEKMSKSSTGEFRRVASALLSFHTSESKRKAAEQLAERLAYYDQLTQLPNRQLLNEHLQHSMKISQTAQRSGALVCIDIDQFSSINAVRGFATGDQLLKIFAERFNKLIKDPSAPGRLGGDQFTLILDNLHPKRPLAARQAREYTFWLQEQLSQPYVIDGETYSLTLSLGLVFFDDCKEDANHLLRKGESAMRLAKESGGNQICFYDPSIQAELEERIWIEKELHLALERNQLELHYQLQVGKHNQPLGAEALLRWTHPEKGPISPGQFIPLAEESDLILSVGHWVLETACKQLKAWETHPATAKLELAVNVSARQFQQDNWVEEVQGLVEQTGINPQRLKLEITESALLTNMNPTITKMKALQELGIRFSMDDFGTGYSSLQYLKRLPLQQLKIDQSFVRDLPGDQEALALVETIVAMGHALKLDVIAEGVETQDQLMCLTRMQCSHYQGYLFAKPMTATDLIERLTGEA
ncbi:diguanylate cyclase (GGDEF) domain-containing protein [Marinospirillum celere]|uniref:Diguanylate cyclase (GGDEF) domain-containing protein n=1 Tax=Marinospirillum celere TaxID=1122252 RepID=A0A1I1FUL6_9GAMM|nr:bifunctional diguanylate cyclase/phosphodiesterase [Marinospirillum celere]SFC00680.1 diguanylate cyclase (GGDEF) domain-containing protein [Marinospirillum celere]